MSYGANDSDADIQAQGKVTGTQAFAEGHGY